ncbi:MAG: hypothetical protein E6J38_03115 [Chloroflexi bacterium]|nr:MAG: hypothetical protein E6J38_03115 [Chloroflexota bacterium]
MARLSPRRTVVGAREGGARRHPHRERRRAVLPPANRRAPRREVREKQDRDIATALLDQSVISGIGNVFKVEALFLAKLSPWAPVRDLSDDQLRAVVAQARKLIRLNRSGGERRTRFSLDPSDRMWVDERAGLPCHVCGTRVEHGWHPGEDVRKSWYCPHCQNVKPEDVYRAAPVPAMRMPHRERL